MKSDVMVGTSLRLPKALKQEAERLAKRDRRTFAQIARIAIEQWVARRSKKAA